MQDQNLDVIALFDTAWSGHHGTYFKSIAKALLDLNYEVWAFCPEPEDLMLWLKQNIATERLSRLICKPMADISYKVSGLPEKVNAYHKYFLKQGIQTVSLWVTTYRVIRTLSNRYRKVPRLVFFPTIDGWLSGMARPELIDKVFPLKWSGVYISPLHLRVKETNKNPFIRLYNYAFKFGIFSAVNALKSKYCIAVPVLDENITEPLSKQVSKKVMAFPDITDESQPDMEWIVVKDILKKANGRRIIGMLGGLQSRKGVFTLLEIAKRLNSKSYFFLFAGRFLNEEERHLFRSKILSNDQNYDNLYVYLEYVPDGAKFNALVKACDVIFAAYHDHFQSSNIMTKAALFEKPVLVSKGSLMEERVRIYETGLSITQGSVAEGIKAIEFLCNEFWSRKNPKFSEYFAKHSHLQLSRVLSEIVSLAQ